MDLRIAVQTADFDANDLQRELTAGRDDIGAIATFTGLVRSRPDQPVSQLHLEHYPGMTERRIADIVEQAAERWEVLSARIVHRVGDLVPGDQIVYVGVSSGHRGDAFAACEFIMDFLKTEAPFWKKETTPSGQHWVDARDSDDEAKARWLVSGPGSKI